MKLNFLSLFAIVLLISCGESTSSTSTTDSTAAPAAATEEVTYVYTIDHPDQWEWGTKKNTETALKALKGFETGDIAGTMQYWGDSVRVEFDNYEAKLSNDSLKTMFTGWRANFSDIKVDMEDFESVISQDKSKEYVSLWYKQVSTTTKGVVDSVECMDDLLFKDGKIIMLNEKTRKLGPAKK